MADIPEASMKRFVALQKMSPQLKELAADVIRTRDEVLRLRYELAVRLRQAVEQEDLYGSDAVNLLARALGDAPATFVDLARVGRAFHGNVFESLRAARFANGGQVTIEHLVALAGVLSYGRDAVIKVLFERSFTPRQPTKYVRDQEAARQAELARRRPAKLFGDDGGGSEPKRPPVPRE